MIKQKNIPDFVFACLQKTSTEQDIEKLNQWLKLDNNAQLYSQLKKIDIISNDYKLYKSFDIYSAEKNIKEAIRKKKRKRFISSIQRYAAFLLIPTLLLAAFYIYKAETLNRDLSQMNIIQQVNTQPCTRSHFFLPDSTEVWLNSSSTISFPLVFNGSRRLVELNGEAYFKVYKNKKKPFIVKNGEFKVMAVGTAFNFCAYTGDNKYSVSLEEGEIKVSEGSLNKKRGINKTTFAKPGEQVTFYNFEKKMIKSSVDIKNIVAWKEGRLIFDNTPLSDVVVSMGRWFNADINLEDNTIANYRYTATFTNESLMQVLDLLEMSAPIEYSVIKRSKDNNNTYTKESIKLYKK